MRRALLLCFVAACKSDEALEAKAPIPAPATFVSGSRLKAIFREVDGVRLFGAWQDTQLGKPCAFLGNRCLPGTTRIEQEALALFEDDACTSRLARMSEDSAFGGVFDTIAFVDGSPTCRELSIHVRGEAVAPARVFRRNPGGACEETPAGGDFVRVGPALGPDDRTFVTAREENDAAGGRVVVRWRVADDGAREIIGAWDTERNERVASNVSASGRRWFPTETATVGGNSSCRELATTFSCTPTVALFGGGAGCRDPELYTLGAKVDASACPGAAGDIYEVGAKIPASAYSRAERLTTGAGRVRLEMDGTAAPLTPVGFFDTEARAQCTYVPFDGVLRCQPERDSRATDAFADEACTQKAMLWRPSSGACDASPDVPRYITLQDGSLIEVGAPIAGAWTSGPSGCLPATLGEDTMAYVVSPLEPSRLAVVLEKTE